MSDWWKAPVLQGEDNDYGQYDYLIEEIPESYAKWEFSKYKWACDSCKKETHLLFRDEYFFHTLDGWDSIAHATCWRCRLKDNIRCTKWKAKKRIKTFKLARKLYKTGMQSFKDCYKLAKKLER